MSAGHGAVCLYEQIYGSGGIKADNLLAIFNASVAIKVTPIQANRTGSS